MLYKGKIVLECPFCGCNPQIRILSKKSVIIECVNCYAAGLLRKSLDLALAAWNCRYTLF